MMNQHHTLWNKMMVKRCISSYSFIAKSQYTYLYCQMQVCQGDYVYVHTLGSYSQNQIVLSHPQQPHRVAPLLENDKIHCYYWSYNLLQLMVLYPILWEKKYITCSTVVLALVLSFLCATRQLSFAPIAFSDMGVLGIYNTKSWTRIHKASINKRPTNNNV